MIERGKPSSSKDDDGIVRDNFRILTLFVSLLVKTTYVCVKFSRFASIGLRRKGSYDPDIIILYKKDF